MHEQIEYVLHWSRSHLPDVEVICGHLAAGAATSLLVAIIIASLCRRAKVTFTDSAAGDEDAIGFDQRLLNWAHASAHPFLTNASRLLARLGSPPLMLVLALIAAGFVLPLRGAVWTLPVAIFGADVLIQGLKSAFRRPRPALLTPLLHESGYLFPSGHSLIAIVVYGLLVYFALCLFDLEDGRFLVVPGTVLLISLIEASRVYVGVHFPTDVIAGWAAGLPWLLACIWLYEALTRHWHQAGEPVLKFTPSLFRW